MDNIYYYIEVIDKKSLGKKLGFQINKKRLLEIKNEKIVFYDKRFEEFYRKYENQLHSFKIQDLRKLYDETGIRVCHFIDNIDKELKDNKKVPLLSSNLYSVSYIDYEDDDNSYYEYDVDKLKKRDQLYAYRNKKNIYEDEYTKSDYFDELRLDLNIRTIPDELKKDQKGIYIIKDNYKEYVYSFE